MLYRLVQFSVLSAFAGVAAGRAELEWRGTIIRGDTPTFALMDTSSGNSKWVPLNGSFDAFVVTSYDPQRQVLVLEKEGVRRELTLAIAKPADTVAPAEPVPSPTDELSDLGGIPLAEAMASRGDAQVRELLAKYRQAAMRVDELARQLADLERASDSNGEAKSGRGADARAAIASLRQELETATQQATEREQAVERLVASRRGQP